MPWRHLLLLLWREMPVRHLLLLLRDWERREEWGRTLPLPVHPAPAMLPLLLLLPLPSLLPPLLLPLWLALTLLLLSLSLGLKGTCATRARAHPVSLQGMTLWLLLPPSLLLLLLPLLLLPLLLLLLLLWRIPAVPELTALPPPGEAPRVPTPRRVLPGAVQVLAEGVVPDGGADPSLLRQQCEARC